MNEDALQKLEREGVAIYPRPSALKIIKNKILQKQFYKQHEIPTSDYIITENINDLVNKSVPFRQFIKLPMVAMTDVVLLY